MFKIEAEEVGREFGPQAVNSEVALRLHGVMKEDDRAVAEFGAPGFVVGLDGVIGVQAIDVQQVHGRVGDVRQGLVKGHAKQGGEGFVAAVEFVEIEIDGFPVMVSVGVAEPGVDGIAVGGELQFSDGLAESAVGDAVLCAEFDDGAGMKHLDEGHGEGGVLGPAGFFVQALGRTVEELPVEGIELGAHGSMVHEMRI